MSEDQIAQQTQEKFDFYFLSLIFTLLALSIQTSKFGRSPVEDLLELVGWLGFLVSGLVGLWRMEWDPTLRVQASEMHRQENTLAEMRKGQQAGVTMVHILSTDEKQSIQDHINRLVTSIDSYRSYITKLERTHTLKYQVMRCSFILGLLSEIASRGFGPVAKLMGCSTNG